MTQDPLTKTPPAPAVGSEQVASVRRGADRYEAGQLSAGDFARGLRKLADQLEKLDGKTSVKTEDVREVFVAWVRATGKDATRTKLTPERDRKIRGRLREGYTVADIKAAIENVSQSSFHCGENEHGRAYNDITLICRSGSQLEQYRDMGPAGKLESRGQLPLVTAGSAPQARYKGPSW